MKDVFIAFVYSIALFFVFCFWISLLYFVLGYLGAGSVPFFNMIVEHFKDAQDFYMVLIFYVALFVAMRVKIFEKYKVRVFDFFVKKETLKADMIYGAATYGKFFVMVGAGVILILLVASMWDMIFRAGALEQVNIFFAATKIEKFGTEDRIAGISGIILLFICAPFFEELFFRGCLYRALRARFPHFWAVVVSSFVFSLLHGYFFIFFYVFIVGLLLAHMYEKKGSLVAPLIFHMLNNLVVILLLFLRF